MVRATSRTLTDRRSVYLLAEKVDRLLTSLPGDDMLGRLGAGNDLAAPDDKPAGGHQSDGVALVRRVEQHQVGATAGFQSVVDQSEGTCAVDGDHVDQRPDLFVARHLAVV